MAHDSGWKLGRELNLRAEDAIDRIVDVQELKLLVQRLNFGMKINL